MKIALTNCWHDDNKGDSGIVWGTIESILYNYPNAQISLVSTFSEDDPRYENSFRHLQRRFPSIDYLIQGGMYYVKHF
jgi:polysaccharide pyruvyl transferase WcaK-like protein